MLSEKTDPYLAQPNGRAPESGNQGLAPEEKACLRITSMSGSGCGRKETTSSVSELDLSHCTNGIYLLHIVAGGQETTWKIIKK